MGVFDMVAMIVVVGCIAGVLIELIKAKGRSRDDEIGDVSQERLDDLEERVRVLERVVTDERLSLGRQIDELQRD